VNYSGGSLIPFSDYRIFEFPATHICLVLVKNVRNVETFKYALDTSKGPIDLFDYGSVVELEIMKVLWMTVRYLY